MAGPNHHNSRQWREHMRPAILERDGWICQLPHCKAAEWLAHPPRRDQWFATVARQWIANQHSTRVIWRDAPKLGGRFHPLSASVDMDPPKSLGGDDTNPNHLRAGHLLCNVARGNGVRQTAHQPRYTSSAPRIT
jgi:hypothetical protein